MTYCVGIEVDEGLVFAADTRTNASLDESKAELGSSSTSAPQSSRHARYSALATAMRWA